MSAARVVAITGASAGIGRATALRLARDGAAVVASARRADRLNALAREIEGLGGQALAVVADVTPEADMQRLRREAGGPLRGAGAVIFQARLRLGGSPH